MTKPVYCNIPNIVNNSDEYYSKKLNVKKSDNLYLIKYKKSELNKDNISTLGAFRSVITDGQKLVCVAPTKSINFENFILQNTPCDCSFEEFVEGTMINAFHDGNKWEIATRSRITADCHFNKDNNKTFREMFFETNFDFNNLDPKYSYSFVLQHPENRIVVPFEYTNVVLVAINEYDGFNVLPKDIRDKEFELLRNFVKIPEIYAFNDKNWRETELLYKNCDYRIVGCMIKNIKTNERTKIRNNNYENVRKLKGNSNKLQYQYYWLRKHKKIQEYLRYFPEHNDSFMEFQNVLHSWTIELLKNYTNCFIKKEKRLKEYPFQFRIHMYNLHQLYLNKKFNNNNERFYINKEVVINHINDLDAAALMYLINFKNSD